MKKLLAGFVVASLILCFIPGCKSNGEQKTQSVSSDLVTNPITASGKKAEGTLPQMTFEQTKHDFGMMVQGEKLSYTFKFTNTGGSDLIISNASSTCGCTIPKYSKEPVKPGGKGEIEVVFNSAGKSGTNTKTIKLLTNAQPNTVELEITAEVYVPDSKK
jgi:hypothetical protein